MIFMLGVLAGTLLLGILLTSGGKLDPCPVCPEPEISTKIEHIYIETVVEPECEPCLEIRVEEDYIWVYKGEVPVAFFPRECLINQ